MQDRLTAALEILTDPDTTGSGPSLEIPAIGAPLDPTMIEITRWPLHGFVEVALEDVAIINYVADGSYSGIDSFEYEISFADGRKQSAVVKIVPADRDGPR